MKSNIAIVLALIAIAFGWLGMVGGNNQSFAGVTNLDSLTLSEALVTATLTTSGAMTVGGDVTITTTDAATSSVEVGCIDTYATSTATALRLSATTTPGIAYWTYGTCSEL